ncbi:MAG: sugar phosphate isomerase/epimerase family protein [Burkholderiaceae bacterium]
MRFSLCNEVLRDLPFQKQCEMAAQLGYDGLEIAPFTLCDDPRTLTDSQVGAVRRALADHGLACTGLHWLLVTPAGLSVSTDDSAVLARTRELMTRLCALAAELEARVLVHGSPAQRRLPADPALADAARDRAIASFEIAARAAQKAGVIYCLEPLARTETNFVNTVREAADIVSGIGSEHLRTMIDCSAAGNTEDRPVADLVLEWMPTGLIAHVQVNDPNRRGPGQGDMRFAPILQALVQTGYAGDVAVEPFDYVPDGPGCAARAIGYLKGLVEAGA